MKRLFLTTFLILALPCVAVADGNRYAQAAEKARKKTNTELSVEKVVAYKTSDSKLHSTPHIAATHELAGYLESELFDLGYDSYTSWKIIRIISKHPEEVKGWIERIEIMAKDIE